jgi:hypothetical protein
MSLLGGGLVQSSGGGELSEDLSPSLGGDLDVLSNSIISSTGDVEIDASATGGSDIILRHDATGKVIIPQEGGSATEQLEISYASTVATLHNPRANGSFYLGCPTSGTVLIEAGSSDFTINSSNVLTNRSILATASVDIGGTSNKFRDGFFSGEVLTGASTTSKASVNIPHGTAPTSPVDGDMWTTTAGLYVRINGSTVGPLS